MFGYIYKVTNVDTGSYYIGKHKYIEGEEFMEYLGSSNHPDFTEYPRKCFVKELLEEAPDEETLTRLEARYIRENLGKAGNVNQYRGIGYGGQYGYEDNEWSKKSNPKEELSYCEKCGKETYHYHNGACKGCTAKITYDQANAGSYFKKQYQVKFCKECNKMTKHSGKDYENCASCYNSHGLNLYKHDGVVSLRNGTNIVIEDVSFIFSVAKDGNSYKLPTGIKVTDGKRDTDVWRIIRNPDIADWLYITVKLGNGRTKRIRVTADHPFVTTTSDFVKARDLYIGYELLSKDGKPLEILDIKPDGNKDYSYDLETASGFFNFSGIKSRNCRTRLFNDVYGKNTSVKRGNASFTSINLPRIALEADHDLDKFFKLLDDKLQLVHDQLLERFEYQCSATVDEFKYMAENNTQAEDFKKTENIRDAIKHSSLSIGFIGLAEALIALIGKHHGESEEAQELGLKIVKHMRDFCDAKKEEEKLNWSLLATPAEGLAERFVKIDREKYGVIDGVTDKDYYTNSSHVPVYYKIGAFEKIDIEAPYHALENAGHIAYIELDGDPSQNIQALESVVRHMHDKGIGYGAINHPVDKCRDCGYRGAGIEKCPICGSTNIEKLRRITGYLVGSLDRWNNGKRAEEHDRVKHATPYNANGVYTTAEKDEIEALKREEVEQRNA